MKKKQFAALALVAVFTFFIGFGAGHYARQITSCDIKAELHQMQSRMENIILNDETLTLGDLKILSAYALELTEMELNWLESEIQNTADFGRIATQYNREREQWKKKFESITQSEEFYSEAALDRNMSHIAILKNRLEFLKKHYAKELNF